MASPLVLQSGATPAIPAAFQITIASGCSARAAGSVDVRAGIGEHRFSKTNLASLAAPLRPIQPEITATATAPGPGNVWPVESNERFDLYSNGLRVENQYLSHTQPRAYLAYARDRFDPRLSTLRLDPAGIVYHTTESHMAPFEERENRSLRRAGEGLLEHVRRNHSYPSNATPKKLWFRLR